MPKISYRARAPSGIAPLSTAPAPAVASMKVRKVSFENQGSSSDGNQSDSSSSSSCASSCASLHPLEVREAPLETLVALKRPRTHSSHLSSLTPSEEVSPVIHTTSSAQSSCTSPWGQFVDVIPPDDDYDDIAYTSIRLPQSPKVNKKLRRSYPFSFRPYELRKSGPLCPTMGIAGAASRAGESSRQRASPKRNHGNGNRPSVAFSWLPLEKQKQPQGGEFDDVGVDFQRMKIIP